MLSCRDDFRAAVVVVDAVGVVTDSTASYLLRVSLDRPLSELERLIVSRLLNKPSSEMTEPSWVRAEFGRLLSDRLPLMFQHYYNRQKQR